MISSPIRGAWVSKVGVGNHGPMARNFLQGPRRNLTKHLFDAPKPTPHDPLWLRKGCKCINRDPCSSPRFFVRFATGTFRELRIETHLFSVHFHDHEPGLKVWRVSKDGLIMHKHRTGLKFSVQA